MPASKWLHILGAGIWQVPLIERAKELGYRVFVTDMYKERPGYAIADDHQVIDIRDCKKTLAAAKQTGIHGSLCDGTDVGVPTAAYVADALGLPSIGYETALNFTHKDRMRQKTHHAGLASPRFQIMTSLSELSNAVQNIGYPLVIKPVDNQSSRGVMCLRTPQGLQAAAQTAFEHSVRHTVLVEEWIQGTEVTVESFCWDGKITAVGVSDKVHFEHVPQVASRLTYPPAVASNRLSEIVKVNQAVIKALGLQTGVTHAEYILSPKGVFPIDIAARGGGSRIFSHIVPYLGGYDIPKLFLEWCLAEAPRSPAISSLQRAANLEFIDFPEGRVQAISGLDRARAVPGVAEVWLDFKEGDVLRPIQDDRSRKAFILTLGKERKEVLDVMEKAKSLINVRVQ